MSYNITKINNNTLEKQIKEFIENWYLKKESTYIIDPNLNIDIDKHIKQFCSSNFFHNKYKIKHNYTNKNGKIYNVYLEQITNKYKEILLQIKKKRDKIIEYLDVYINDYLKNIKNINIKSYINFFNKRVNISNKVNDIYKYIKEKYDYHLNDEKIKYEISKKIKNLEKIENLENKEEMTSSEQYEYTTNKEYDTDEDMPFGEKTRSNKLYQISKENSFKNFYNKDNDNHSHGGSKKLYTGSYRHFKIVEVNGKSYENTAIADIKEHQSPLSAASKLLGSYCRSEGIKKMDRPKMRPVTFSIRETTKDSKKKIFGPYHGHYIKYTPAQMKEASAAGITFTMKPVVKLYKK